jgi:hypothetical protein
LVENPLASAIGDVRAVGEWHFGGTGRQGDQPMAFEYYTRAAKRGHARAMNLLARCMEEGWGTPKDIHS